MHEVDGVGPGVKSLPTFRLDPCGAREGRAMSHSMYTAGRTTYLKIVVVALLCAIVFTVMGLTARVGEMNGARKPSRIEASRPVIRARALAPANTAQNAD